MYFAPIHPHFSQPVFCLKKFLWGGLGAALIHLEMAYSENSLIVYHLESNSERLFQLGLSLHSEEIPWPKQFGDKRVDLACISQSIEREEARISVWESRNMEAGTLVKGYEWVLLNRLLFLACSTAVLQNLEPWDHPTHNAVQDCLLTAWSSEGIFHNWGSFLSDDYSFQHLGSPAGPMNFATMNSWLYLIY